MRTLALSKIVCNNLKKLVLLGDTSEKTVDSFLNSKENKEAFLKTRRSPKVLQRRGGKGNIFHHLVQGLAAGRTRTCAPSSGGSLTEATRRPAMTDNLLCEELGNQTAICTYVAILTYSSGEIPFFAAFTELAVISRVGRQIEIAGRRSRNN